MRLKRAIGWLAAVAAGLAAWAFVIEPASLRVEEYRLALPGWPADQAGLRIALLADLHVGSPFNGVSKLEEIVARTNDAGPHLVLLAGDFVIHNVLGGSLVPPEEIARKLGALSAPLGAYAVLGNHEWWFDAPRVARAFEAAGIPVLEDRAIRIEAPPFRFWLAGLSDFWEGPHDLGGTLAQVEDDGPVLLFTHNPDVFPEIPERVSLTLAGHTHGGQVRLPLLGRPIVPSSHGQRFAAGHVVEEGRHLFVATGTGTSILPVRFRVPPEISIVALFDEHRAGW